MTDKFKIAKINTGNFTEETISTQLRTVISRWVSFAARYYSDWDYKPDCGYFFSGAYNYGVETSATIMAVTITAVFGKYNEKTVGVSKDRLVEMIIGSIRYLCFTHHTGPSDCVREKSRNPVTSGKKWGHTPGNFFMSSQTGVSVSMLGMASWILWDKLDNETRDMVSGVLEFYADEYCDMTPGTGVYNDTQCEENAWTSLGISAAYYMFPDHPHSEKWLDGYIRWSLNSVTTYKDKLNNELDKVTGESRGGFSYKGKIYGISSTTFHPDFTTENHGYVHPDYMSAGIILRVSSGIFALLRGEEPLGSLFFNFDNLYNDVLKPWCGADGNPIPVQGQDWFYHRHHNKLIMHSAMNLFFDDADAAMFERKCIDIMFRRQESTGNGRLLEKNGEALEVTPGKQSAFDMEYGAIRTVVLTYLMHLIKGDGMDPEYPDVVMKKLAGNHMYPYGGVYIYRTPDTFASFTTRCSIMGLSLPAAGMWDITADFQGFTGLIKEKNSNDEYFANKKINWKDIGIESVRGNLEEYEAGFSVMTEVPRAGGVVMQMSSFSALPDGKTVYVEKCRSLGDVELSVYDTGKVTVGNENFRFLPEFAKGYKDIYFNGKATRFYGSYDEKDVVVSYRGLRHVNVADKIGYILYGSNGVEYLNKHNYPKWKGLEDTLILNKREPFSMKAGEKTKTFAVTVLHNTGIYRMDREYTETAVTCSDGDIFVQRTKDNRVSVNFSDKKTLVKENIPHERNKVRIYRGRTIIRNGDISASHYVDGFSSCVDEVHAMLRMDNGITDMDIICADGFVIISNNTDYEIKYTYTSIGIHKEIIQSSGETIELTYDGIDSN